MASQEGTAKDAQFVVICKCPDVCKTPGAPVPHQILAYLEDSVLVSGNVNFRGKPAFHMKSRVPLVIGDEAGLGGGVASGVNGGFCRPVVPVTTVRVNETEMCRHEHTEFEMNCAGPEGPSNTIGKVVYLGAMCPGPVGPGGAIPAAANPPTSLAPPQFGSLGQVAARAAAGSVADVIALASKAYEVANTDWSNPAAVLGAMGGLASDLGMDGLAAAAGQAKKVHDLAETNWNDPAAVIGAVGDLGKMTGMAPLSDLADLAQKANQLAQVDWRNPGEALGAVGDLLGPLLAPPPDTHPPVKHITPPGNGPATPGADPSAPEIPEKEPGLTRDQLQAIMPHLSSDKADTMLPHLNDAMEEADISTPLRQSAFLAQLAHESGEFRYMEEIASGAAYEGRSDLGNTEPGDGRRFKGRGPIQLTGRDNYRRAGDALGLDLLSKPESVAKPEVGFRTSAWYWNSRGINGPADKGDFREVTRRINGGYNGLADRQRYYKRAKETLGAN